MARAISSGSSSAGSSSPSRISWRPANSGQATASKLILTSKPANSRFNWKRKPYPSVSAPALDSPPLAIPHRLQGRPQRRALLDLEAYHRNFEHIGEDLAPHRALCPASGEPPLRRLNAQFAQTPKAVIQSQGSAFHGRAHHVRD